MARRIRLIAVALAVTVCAPQALATTAPVVPTGSVERTLISHPRPDSEAFRPVPKNAKCPQWWNVALDAGWKRSEMATLDFIMHRESRCQPGAHNTTMNADGSTDLGLTQINDRSWCLPNRFYKQGYLQSLGIITYCEDLFDPTTNLGRQGHCMSTQKKTGAGSDPGGYNYMTLADEWALVDRSYEWMEDGACRGMEPRFGSQNRATHTG